MGPNLAHRNPFTKFWPTIWTILSVGLDDEEFRFFIMEADIFGSMESSSGVGTYKNVSVCGMHFPASPCENCIGPPVSEKSKAPATGTTQVANVLFSILAELIELPKQHDSSTPKKFSPRTVTSNPPMVGPAEGDRAKTVVSDFTSR